MKDKFRNHFREFVQDIRQTLVDDGHSDIMFRTSWFSEREDSDIYGLDVPVGPELTVTLRSGIMSDENPTIEDWAHEARTIASALITLHKGEKALTKYARDMRNAALREVRKARENGLDIRLTGVSFMRVYAEGLASSDRRGALGYIIAEVRLEVTDYFLRRDEVILTLEEPDEVSKAIKEYVDEQEERQHREDELERDGADLEISDISLDILRLTGSEPHKLLCDLVEHGVQNFTLSDGARIALMNYAGVAITSLETDEIYWNGKVLHLRKGEISGDASTVTGKPLAGLLENTIFASRPVEYCSSYEGNSKGFYYAERFFNFDAASRRIWDKEGEQRVAA